MSKHRRPASPRGGATVFKGAAVAFAFAIGGAGSFVAVRSRTPSLAPTASAPAASAAASVARITLRSAPLGRTVSVVVSPPDAHVQIDGMDAPVQRGVVTFTGGLGTVHRVRLSAGQRETAVDVTIAEEGPVPPEVRVGKSAVGARR